ncbi:hypothetical protein EVAR_17825_1 [Eumeta japonica]|uniref:Uncharacterized protein n=1 Tax=Eumeta variegata TaxID=151549 RepID=A0A4C1TTM6_EUMVA|nr:hypothetical protein EVAR_17825_1 [Eumeta japonica]
MQDMSKKFFDTAANHPNPLLQSAVSYEPPSHPHIISSEGHGMFFQTHLTNSPLRSKEREDEGSGSLTYAALAAAVGCMDSLISGRRRARSVRSTRSGSPMCATLNRSAFTGVRRAAVGCVYGLNCASPPP